jgi:PAS domain S-box-containing protein
MNSLVPPLRSLRTKVTVFTLAIFVASIWALFAFANHLLHQNIGRLVGQQQTATVTFMAAEIDRQLRDRSDVLEKITGSITADLLADPAAAQRFLADRLTLLNMFNSGAFLVDAAGRTVAELPLATGRTETDHRTNVAVSIALRQGATNLSPPIIGQPGQPPVFTMAAAVRTPDGRVLGALAGVIDLKRPNFLYHLAGSRYGINGYFILTDAATRAIIACTDPDRGRLPLPPPGQNALIDRHLAGQEETGFTQNPLGVEVMASAARIAFANWFLVAALPTTEAFAPIEEMRHGLTLAAVALTLLAGALTGWMLKRQLSPLLTTAQTLGALADQPGSVVPPLPITRRDEIGVLIGAFNRLLEKLRLREDALQASEGRFRSLVEWSPTAVGVHRGGLLLYVNPAAVTLFGARSAHELVGTPGVDRVHPDYRPNSLARVKKLAEGEPTTPPIAQKFLRLDGTAFEAEVQSISINYDGAPAIYVALTDTTSRQQAELALRTNEARQRKMLANIGDVIVVIDAAGLNRYKSPNVEKLFGWRPEELVGRSALENIHPDDCVAARRFLAELLAAPDTTNFMECRYLHKNGQYRWVEFTAINLIDDPDLRGILGNYQDITARRAAVVDLRESETLLRESQITAGLGSYLLDVPTGRWRPSAMLREVFGIEENYECTVESWTALIHPADRAGMAAYFASEVLGRGQPFKREYRIVRPRDGAERWVSGLGQLQFDAQGRPLKMHGTIQDITDRQRADDALRTSLREKEALLKEVHHRVKNNLQVIMSLLRMESRRSNQPDTKTVLGEMQGRIRSMALLHESLYRSGTFAAVDLAGYLTQLVTQAFRSAQTSPPTVRLELALDPVLVEMDQALPCGLLVNELVSNALKHAFPGGRSGHVRVALQPVAGEPARWCLAVTDDGVGLPRDFDARRGHSLGLQLVADLAGQLHGTHDILPAPGAGTHIAVTFTIGTQPPSTPSRA